MAKKYEELDINSKTYFGFQWEDRLDSGDSISTSQWFTDEGITVSGSAISGAATYQYFDGTGTEVGGLYNATNRIVTANGDTLEQTLQIKIVQK